MMFDGMPSADSDTLPPLSASTSHHDINGMGMGMGMGMGPPLQRSPYLASVSMLSNHATTSTSTSTCRPVLRRSISLPVVEAPINIPLQQHLQQCGIRRLSTLHPLTVDTPIGPGQLIDRYIHDPHHTSTITSRSPSSSTLTPPTISKIPFAISPIPHDEASDAGIPMGDDHICAVRLSWCIAFFHISSLSINTYRRKSVTFAPDTIFVEKQTSTSPPTSRSSFQPTISTPELPTPCHVSQLRIAVPPRQTYPSYHINGSQTGCFHSDDEPIPSFSHLPPPSNTKNITTSPSPSPSPSAPTIPRSRAERAAAFKQRRADLAAKTANLIQQREKFRDTERSLMADDVAEHSSSSASTSSDEMESEIQHSRKRSRDEDTCITSIRHTKQRLDADTALPASVCIPSVTSASPTGCSPSASPQATGAATYISYLQ